MPDLLSFYYHLPYSLKVVAASFRGYQLNRWRYGDPNEFEERVQEVLERDSWKPDVWSNWSQGILVRLLHKAATEVPYYSSYWSDRRRHGDRRSWEQLENWPVLKKGVLREDPKRFLCESSQKKHLFSEHTSGSTGTPITLFQSRETLQRAYAIFEARVRRWSGLSRQDRWGIIGGQMVVKPGVTNPPFWVWNQAFKQLYLSSYHISARSAIHYHDAIKNHGLQYILAYPSALAALSEFLQEAHLPPYPLKVAISNAEPLFAYQKELVKNSFVCDFINTYGVSELSVGASECHFGNMHLWPEFGMVEVMSFQEDVSLPEGKSGRIITTGLINEDMPLIRYEVGDFGQISAKPCQCGRFLPVLEKIEGRMDDMLLTPDGRWIGRMDPIFKTGIPIREAQIIQEKLDCVRLKYVPADGFDHEKELIARIQERMGSVHVIMEKVDFIPRSPNGKFKAVIQQFDPHNLF